MPEKPTYTHSFRGLLAYKLARELSLLVFERTKQFPKEEAYALTDQIRRSSRSIGANIAEAWAKRRYEKHFISKLTDADGEQQETQHWLETAVNCHYLTPAEADPFCNPDNYLRETAVHYFIEQET